MATTTVTHPDGCYWANTASHAIQRQCNPLLAGALGQIGYVGQGGTPPGLGGHAFVKFTDAQAYLGSHDTPGHQVAHQAADLYHGLNLPNLLLRVGEVVLGVILIGVGIAKITGADNVISAAAKTAGKAAIL